MKYPHPLLAGILNVLIPGLGFVYLKKWKQAIIYFLGVPIYLWIGSIAGYSMIFIPPGAPGIIDPNITFYILISTALLYIVWDLFTTPYFLAKGIQMPIKTHIAVLLNLILPGLGFIYIKRWYLALGFAFWSFFVILIATSVKIEVDNPVISILIMLALALGSRIYVYLDMSDAIRKTIKEMENAVISSSIKAEI